MAIVRLACFVAFISAAYSYPSHKCVAKSFQFVAREVWGARAPFAVAELSLPVPYVIIHHTHQPAACYTREACTAAMKSIQDYHQLTQGWSDIGYNFAVGSDGAVYEGRGWSAVGAHAFGYNMNSIGIVLIGDWSSVLPSDSELAIVKQLISTGIELGYISQDYSLIGHRQVSATDCPGEALYQEISTWDRFSTEV